MEFFTGNPFSTPVGQLIEHATSSSLPSEDWSLNMEICDIVNETQEGPKDAVRAIKKRILGNRNFKEVMLALSVLEACVKNCGYKFHAFVSTRDFVENVLVQTVLPKNNPPVVLQDKVLSMIQAWADAFRSSPDLTGVVTVYEDLRRKGVEFPMTELNGYSPIHTPNRTVESTSPVKAPAESLSVSSSQSEDTGASVPLSPKQMKTLKAELEVVTNNLSVMTDMMNQMEPGSLEPSDTDLLQLHSMTAEIQKKMLEFIPKLGDEKLIERLLNTNDDINTTFAQYQRFALNRQSSAHANLSNSNAVDFDPSDQSNGSFDAINQSAVAALSNQMAGLKRSSPLATHRERQDIGMIPISQSDVMDDIEQWLNVDDDDDCEGVTSEEFDKFLAERAKAAERLPSVTASHHDHGHSQL
ncbi:hypothetical protein DNTS_018805 [Danionella cerebrum]|uniref:VHS domain-containing protein n=1 Tax=Danionella cerebrum TaxID=2873325 RepID=A0A553QN81_9TELE|nr:hypothetical protein DNTS_018805 [Danionella translucida]